MYLSPICMKYYSLTVVTVDVFRLPVPTLVTYNKTSYKSDDEILHETDIGPEVTHIYQVSLSFGWNR